MVSALFFWAVLGGLVGAFAKSVWWFEGPESWGLSLLAGAIGAIAGGFLGGVAGPSGGFDLPNMGLAVIGAGVLLSPYHLLLQRRRATPAYRADDRRAA